VLVTISGLPGSGTSTIAARVAAALGVERVDGGSVFRGLAAEAGMSVSDFSAHAEVDDRVDRELDARLAELAKEGDVVLESRLAGWLAHQEGAHGLRVWIACDEEERAARVAAREGLDAAAALAANRVREASEKGRYLAYYGIDLDDLGVYHVVLDSTSTPAATLVEQILALARDSGIARGGC
jgi:predicted cytidylate kinase